MASTHSKIGASSMYRWSKCPASVKMSVGLPSFTSAFSIEGTQAHELASTILENPDSNLQESTVSKEMLEAVSFYVDFINKERTNKTHEIYIEKKIDLSVIHENLYGTADCIISYPESGLLQVIDFKYGLAPVKAYKNPQLLYYALGAFLNLQNKNIKTVEMIIVQPRIYPIKARIKRWCVSLYEILKFSVNLKEYAVITEQENPPVVAGEHCDFCNASPICDTIKDKALAFSKQVFKEGVPYDPKELGRVLHWLPTLKKWIKRVEDFSLNESYHGRIPEGFKLEPKRAIRRWADENDALEFVLIDLGLNRDVATETKLKTPSQLDKILTKEQKKEIQALTVKISTGDKLVPIENTFNENQNIENTNIVIE